MRENLLLLVFGIVFLIIGTTCLVYPKKIQAYALRNSGQGMGKINPFFEWMKSQSYIFSLRIIGVLTIGVFFLAFFIIFKS